MCRVMDHMWARAVMRTYLRSFIGSRPMCRRAAAMPERQVVTDGAAERDDQRGLRSFFECRPVRVERSGLAEVAQYAGVFRSGTIRASCFVRCRGTFEGPLEHLAPPTGCSTVRTVCDVRGNQWEEGDEWRLRRAQAPADTPRPVRKSGSLDALARATELGSPPLALPGGSRSLGAPQRGGEGLGRQL